VNKAEQKTAVYMSDNLFIAAPAMYEALQVLADIPVEEFGFTEARADQPFYQWNDHSLMVSHVFAARAALKQARGGV